MKKVIIISLLTVLTLELLAQKDSTKLIQINMESILPNIFVKDIQKTIEFYKILGFEVNDAIPDRDNPIFVLMTCGKTTFMFQTFSSSWRRTTASEQTRRRLFIALYKNDRDK